jgi:NADH/NAD ratio-sensing transcriptional regulator Rex
MTKKKLKKGENRFPMKSKTKYKAEDWDFPPNANEKNGAAWDKLERIRYLKHLLSLGILNPKKQELAEKMGVDRRTIFNDYKEIYRQGVDGDEVDATKTQLCSALKNGIVEASNLVITSKGKDKLQAISVLSSISKDYVEFLEKFDIKRPGVVADREIVIKWADNKTEGEVDK